MTLVKPLAIRLATLAGVLFLVLVALVITLGATGFSDRLLEAQVGEDLRGLRQRLSPFAIPQNSKQHSVYVASNLSSFTTSTRAGFDGYRTL